MKSIALFTVPLLLVFGLCCGHGPDGYDEADVPQDRSGDPAGTDAGPDSGQEEPGPEETPPPDPEGEPAWSPSVGIPRPEFGVVETVEADCPTCTVLTDPPLETISNLPAGTVVLLTEGPHTGSAITVGGSGTAARPIFVRGPSADARPVIDRKTTIKGSYVIVENIDFDFGGKYNSIKIEGNHIALRHCEVHNYDPGHNATTVYIANSESVVLYGNAIHDNGDFEHVGEQDVHGVGGGDSHKIWILENHMHHNRGDSIQFGHRAGNTVGEIYIGRNDLHDDGENCVDIKEASNVVISQNRLHGTTPGMPIVALHDCPVNAAVIYNEIYGAETGVTMASLEDACAPYMPISLFVLKNQFHDVPGTGIEAWGTQKRYFVTGNVFNDVGERLRISTSEVGSIISEGDSGLSEAFAAYFSVHGVDISTP